MSGERYASERRNATTQRYRTKVDMLRKAWRDAAGRARWARPEDWWTPAVDALAQAVTEHRDAEPACARLGRARAEARIGIRETIGDLDTLYRQLPTRVPPPRLVRALVEAWASVALAPVRLTLCGDGFASREHLRARLAEIYARGDPARDYAAIVIDLPDPMVGTGWEALTLLLQAGRSVLPDDTRPARLSPGQLAVLVRRHGELAEATAAIRSAGATVRVVYLPETLAAAERLVDGL